MSKANVLLVSKRPIRELPGAGIPLPQKIVLKAFVGPFVANKSSPFLALDKIQKISVKMATLINEMAEHKLEQRVLIDPTTGLEDSSRDWSIIMTAEHIAIVGEQVQALVNELCNGRTPQGKADIAAVKPPGIEDTKKILERFRNYCKGDFESLAQLVNQSETRLSFHHPWFGALNHRGWYWLLATHHGIHYQQMKKIKMGLEKSVN